MKKGHKIRKLLFFAMLFVFGITLQHTSAYAKYGTSGSMNNGAVRWELNTETGVLTVTGTGEMDDSSSNIIYQHWDRKLVKKVVIGEGITRIGNYEFKQHPYLTSVEIPSTLRSIGTEAFYGTPGITTITLPEGMTELGDKALMGMDGLTTIHFPSTLTTMGKGVFTDCDGLTEITIPDTVTTMGANSFSGCDNLQKVNLPKYLDAIPAYMFSGDKKLAEITIPDTVKSIGEEAFFSCPIKSLVIPASVQSLDKYALVSETLKTVYFKGKAPTVTNRIFSTTKTRYVLIPKQYKSSYNKMKSTVKKYNSNIQWDTWNPNGLKAPDVKSVDSAGYNSIKITWKQYSKATKFEVYRSTKRTSGFKKVATIKKGTATSYTDKKLTSGKSYYYKVRAYVGSKKTELTTAYKEIPVPSQPKSAKAYKTKTPYKVKVKWKKVAGASGYEILRGRTLNGSYSVSKVVDKKTTSTLVVGLSHVHNYYRVRAYRTVNGKKVYGPTKSAGSIYLNNVGR
jgi:hypothetical protein